MKKEYATLRKKLETYFQVSEWEFVFIFVEFGNVAD